MLEQREAIAQLADMAHRDGALVVSEIGSQSVWLYDSGDDSSHLYLSGPMGMAPSVALGVALVNPSRPVLGICGDGALAMNATSLITASHVAPGNLTLAVMDNGVYEFTGAAASPSQTVDWTAYIGGLTGFTACLDLADVTRFTADEGLRFVHCKIGANSGKAAPFALSPPEIHKRFKGYCQSL